MEIKSIWLSENNQLTTTVQLTQEQADAIRSNLALPGHAVYDKEAGATVVEKAPRKARETKPAAAVETKPAAVVETKVEKAAEAVKAEVADDDFLEGGAEEEKTPLDVRNILIAWVGDDAERKKTAIKRFGEVTGLSSLKEVDVKNASSIYAKLKADLS